MVLEELRQDAGAISIGLSAFYPHLGISRQGAHQLCRRVGKRASLLGMLKEEILDYRASKDNRAGSRSLYYNLEIKSRFDIGVNKFEGLVKEAGLTLAPLHKRVITTKSSLRSYNHSNLISGLQITGTEQVVVGDLTYLDLGADRYYLFLLTDAYNHAIVGHCLSRRCRAEEALEALNGFIGKAIQPRKFTGCIHHTDGGTQYFSRLYQDRLLLSGLTISVAKNCLENGIAEQKNGLFKNHFLHTINWREVVDKPAAMAKLIYGYNYERKQEKLGWKTPTQYGIEQSASANPIVKVLHQW